MENVTRGVTGFRDGSDHVRVKKFYFIKAVRLVVKCRLMLKRWHRNWATRHHLSALSPHFLADIGVSQQQAAREAAKSFWQ